MHRSLFIYRFFFKSHQIADITWHSLGVPQGFLTTMGDVKIYFQI